MTLSPISNARDYTVFFGTSSARDSKGIYSTRFDAEEGLMDRPVELAARIDSPGWITWHPTLPLLYSSGVNPETKEPVLAVFRLQSEANSPILEKQGEATTGCGRPTHLMVHPSGTLVATVYYDEGVVALFKLGPDGNILERTQRIQLQDFSSVDPKRQEKAHPHYCTFDPSGNYLLVPDLGADAVYVYKVDTRTASLKQHDTVQSAPGAGPRHMKFTRSGKYAFILNELGLTVDSCSWDAASGILKHLYSAATLPAELKDAELENTASEIRIHPGEKFLYAGNRGNDSISVFSIDMDTGQLERTQVMPTRTAWPRNFNFDPEGKWIICGGQDSDNAGVFLVDQETGQLTYQPHSNVSVPSPICILFRE